MLLNRPTAVFRAIVLGDLAAVATALWACSQFESDGVSVLNLVGFVGTYLVLVVTGRVHVSIRATEARVLLGKFALFAFHFMTGIGLVHLLESYLEEMGPEVGHDMWLMAPTFLFPIMALERFAVLALSRLSGRQSDRRTAIVGTGDAARATADAIAAHPGWGIELVGFLRTSEEGTRDVVERGMKSLGHFSQLPNLVRDIIIDEIVVADPGTSLECVEEIVRISELLGLRAFILADFCQNRSTTVERTQLAGRMLLKLTPFPDDVFRGSLKRTMDLVGSAAGLFVMAPLLLLLAIAIKLDSPGPVFYSAPRAGRNGRLFKLHKFRTMVDGAHALKSILLDNNEMDGPVFKMRRDPRVTALGRFLRKFSLDELPQLWNVLKGDMSLVGPRPLMPEEVADYEAWQRRRMCMRPGLTCLWQISGRNDVDFQTWMRQDLQYIDNWSLRMDLKILLKTVPVVISGRGAC